MLKIQLSYHKLADHSIFCFSSLSQCSGGDRRAVSKSCTNHLRRERQVAVERMRVWWVHESCKTRLTSSVLVTQKSAFAQKLPMTHQFTLSHITLPLSLPFSLFAQAPHFPSYCEFAAMRLGIGGCQECWVYSTEKCWFIHQTSSLIKKLKTATGHEDERPYMLTEIEIDNTFLKVD